MAPILAAAAALLAAGVAVLALRSALARRPAGRAARAGRLQPCPRRANCVSSEAHDEAHHVAPLPLTGDPAAAIARLKSILAEIPRVTVVEERADYLHAECRSLLFRFVDDLELLALPDRGEIQVRSASRTGRSDLGVNRRRVERLRRAVLAPEDRSRHGAS